MSIVFEAERVGNAYRGEVIELGTYKTLGRTVLYASAEAAKSAAVSMWRVMQANAERSQRMTA